MDSPAARRYQVLAELGSGGMGRVFKARDTRLGRDVALKRLLPTLASDPAAAERFLREARAAAAFSHPHAVHVYDVDRDGDGPFIAMELVEGGSLADRLREGPLTPREALPIIRQVGQALSAAHAAGILHRDVKPGNVLLDSRGVPRLGDFGLALFEGKGELTRSLVGTPEYMAPEQGSDPSRVDARTDVFSLAATLYACLTGEAPRLIRESRIPVALRPTLLRALAERREDRFASMDDFLRALETAGGARARRGRLLFALKFAGAMGATASIVSVGFAILRPALDKPRPSSNGFTSPMTRAAVAGSPPATVGGVVAPAPRVEASFEQIQIYKTVIDAGYALGFVVNKGEAPLESARIELRLLDEQGKLVAGATGYVPADRIEPGAKYPVSVLLKPWPRYAKVEAKVENGFPGFSRPSVKLEAVEKRLDKAQFGGWDLFVKIRNADRAPATYPHVTAVLYATDGRIVGVHDGYIAAKRLGPGEESTAGFQMDSFGEGPPARFELYLYGPAER